MITYKGFDIRSTTDGSFAVNVAGHELPDAERSIVSGYFSSVQTAQNAIDAALMLRVHRDCQTYVVEFDDVVLSETTGIVGPFYSKSDARAWAARAAEQWIREKNDPVYSIDGDGDEYLSIGRDDGLDKDSIISVWIIKELIKP